MVGKVAESATGHSFWMQASNYCLKTVKCAHASKIGGWTVEISDVYRNSSAHAKRRKLVNNFGN